MHSKHKGTLAEMKVTADLYEKGISVALVADDLLPIDLIAIKHNELYKVQVKYSSMKRRGGAKTKTAELNFRSRMSNKNLNYEKTYTREEVDIFALYIPELDKCIYVNSKVLETHGTSMAFRGKETLSGMRNGCHFINDYLDFPLSD